MTAPTLDRVVAALRATADALEAGWLAELDRTHDYSAPPPPALDEARRLLDELDRRTLDLGRVDPARWLRGRP